MDRTKVFQRNHKSLTGWFSYKPDDYLRFILSLLHPKEGDLILDNGCGNGRFSVAIGQNGANVVALDLNLTLLRKALDEIKLEGLIHRTDFVLADVQSLPFRTGAFDKVLCVHNLWYVPRYGIAVKEMFRVLKRSARLLIDHLNLLNPRIFLMWAQYYAMRIGRRNPTPIFYRFPTQILNPFLNSKTDVFSLVVTQRSGLYATKGLYPFCARLIVRTWR